MATDRFENDVGMMGQLKIVHWIIHSNAEHGSRHLHGLNYSASYILVFYNAIRLLVMKSLA